MTIQKPTSIEEIKKKALIFASRNNLEPEDAAYYLDLIEQVRLSTLSEVLEEIDNLIAKEMLICHKENQPTSRLTSLSVKIQSLKKDNEFSKENSVLKDFDSSENWRVIMKHFLYMQLTFLRDKGFLIQTLRFMSFPLWFPVGLLITSLVVSVEWAWNFCKDCPVCGWECNCPEGFGIN